MPNFESFLSDVKTGIVDLASSEGAAHTEQITQDGEAFLESVRYDLEGWLDQLASGSLSPDDFE